MKLFIKITVALLMASLLVAGPAGANTSVTTQTKLTVNDKSVKAGTKVNWKIEVNAKYKKCYANRKVRWLKNGVFKHYKTTGDNGIVKFHKKMWHTSKYQAKLPAIDKGTHPHIHHCKPSHSKVIKITVKPKH